jgi:hypothetical protein
MLVGRLAQPAALGMAVWLALASQLAAQTLTLTNYNRQPLGDQAGLQGGAVTARASDPSATWYNPAGLAQARTSNLSANATVYETSRFSVGGSALYQNTSSTANFLGYTFGPTEGEAPADPGAGIWGLAFAAPVSFNSAASFHTPNGQAGVLNPDGTVTMVATDTTGDASAGVSLLTASVGRGWRTGGGLQLGAALEAGVLTISARQNVSARQPIETGFPHMTLVQELYFYGSEDILRVAGGMQMPLSHGLRLGLTVKSRSLRLGDTAAQRKQGITDFDFSANDAPPASGRRTESTFFTDYRAHFNYVLPYEVHVGLAWVQPSQEWEADLLYYAAVSSYPFFRSDQVATDTTVDQTATSTVNSTTSDRFSHETNSARAVVNVALGGRVRTSERGWWNVGLYTDRSPHNTAAAISGSLDLVGFTTGYTLQRAASSTTLGVVALSGHTANFSTSNFFDPTVRDEYGPASYVSVAAFVAGSLRF